MYNDKNLWKQSPRDCGGGYIAPLDLVAISLENS